MASDLTHRMGRKKNFQKFFHKPNGYWDMIRCAKSYLELDLDDRSRVRFDRLEKKMYGIERLFRATKPITDSDSP